jgi:hypothetical protein
MVEPLRNIPVQIESLSRTADNHDATLRKMETRIEALEMEKTSYDAKHEMLIDHVKEERGKRVGELKSQKTAVDRLGERLEEYRNTEAYRIEYLTENLARKTREDSAKTFQSINQRLDVLEKDNRRQLLLESFTGKPPANKTTDQVRELHDDVTDDASTPLAVKPNRSKVKGQLSSASSGLGKSFLKSKPAPNPKKRKRFGSQENNDRGDDDTYIPKVHSPSTRRKHHG